MIIQTKAYPRAGLVGNPSDGYFGKTISFCFSNFHAEVTLYQSPELEILPAERDRSVYSSLDHLTQDVKLLGYYGGIRLLKAAINKFAGYCRENNIVLDKRNFTIRYHSNIPHLVGLAGSSAIITATFRALMAFYQVQIPPPVLANLILSSEKDELRINAGLQDRVAQVYETPVFMDFGREIMERQGYGRYEPLDVKQFPSLYIAYRDDLSEVSDVFHNNIRERFDRGEKKVLDAMKFWAGLAEKVRAALVHGQGDKIGPLLNANFDMRRKIYSIGPDNIRMVETARSVGASAKFTGSGGAILGTYHGEAMFARLQKELGKIRVKVIKPLMIRKKEKIHDS